MRGLKLFGVDFGQGFLVGVGALGVSLASNTADMIPFPQVKSGWGRLAYKTALVPLVGGVASAAMGRSAGQLIAWGGVASVVTDLYKMVQAQVTGLPALGDYNEVLRDYVVAGPRLNGIAEEVATPGLATITSERTPPLAPWQQ